MGLIRINRCRFVARQRYRQKFWKLVTSLSGTLLQIYFATGCVAEKKLQAPKFTFIDFHPDPDTAIEKILA